MKTTTLTLLSALAASTTAHFNLDYPAARGFNEDLLVQFPCGSFNTPSSNRTLWPLTGGVIQLTMGHVQANVEVLLGLGSDPGSAFNTVLRQTFAEQGLGQFCMTGFTIPDGVNVTDGMNATIQVITNGDPNGGLFNCADITFSSSAPGDSGCKNGTGVTAASASISGNPNETTSTSTSSSSGTTSAGAAATSKSAAGALLEAGIGGLAMAGAAALAIVL
jgi:hypothetical protein